MVQEHCCGAVLYTLKEGVPYYVVVQQKAGNYSFPKGHMEEGETEIETARREISEETGLTAVFRDGFREAEEYGITGSPGARKRVTYYLAEFEGSSFSGRQGEILQVRLLPYEEAIKVFDRPATRMILTRANDLLTGRTKR
jgi:ADP-ribose pyrophosphatase